MVTREIPQKEAAKSLAARAAKHRLTEEQAEAVARATGQDRGVKYSVVVGAA
ncbi:MAG: hypothetical protein QM711_17420 [Micropruina sp.]|uniref:hypothetical protein n=1 Tax=Micropruina sp. TaxID=2737536 RepID=UPI0039E2A2D5